MSLRCTAAACLAGLFALVTAPTARAATVDVQVGGSVGTAFAPATVTIHVGDTVRWTNEGGTHNVRADDNSFKCSDSCSNGSNSPSGNAWSFTRTFNSAGTVAYYCELHGGPGGFGMSGTVVVQPAATQPGAFAFNPASYTVAESGGSVTVHVSRTGGADGAVSVDYAATAGTASAGSDFTPTSGTLHWADQDASDKTFQVAIANDSTTEGSETIHLALSNPGGGASIGTGSGTITIQDDDSGPTAPAAPSMLVATAQSTSDVQLTWKDNSSGANEETAFRIESKTGGGAFSQIASTGADATGATISSLAPATAYTFRVRASNAGGNSAFSNEATATTFGSTAPCVAGPHTLCLGTGGRFKAEVTWTPPGGSAGPANAVPLASAPQSGLFYFVDPSNIEFLIKVLNACIPALGNKYWVFYAATTNVQFSLTVTDTQTGQFKTYTNTQGHAADPIQDTNAFATCP
jgi:plastocyanin